MIFGRVGPGRARDADDRLRCRQDVRRRGGELLPAVRLGADALVVLEPGVVVAETHGAQAGDARVCDAFVAGPGLPAVVAAESRRLMLVSTVRVLGEPVGAGLLDLLGIEVERQCLGSTPGAGEERPIVGGGAHLAITAHTVAAIIVTSIADAMMLSRGMVVTAQSPSWWLWRLPSTWGSWRDPVGGISAFSRRSSVWSLSMSPRSQCSDCGQVKLHRRRRLTAD